MFSFLDDFEYEEFADHHCRGKPSDRIGETIKIGKDTRAIDIEICKIMCLNDNTCTGVFVAGLRCYLRSGYLRMKSKTDMTCYEKKMQGNTLSSFLGHSFFDLLFCLKM